MHVRSLTEDVEGHLNVNDLKPAYRALKKLLSNSTFQVIAIRTADGCLILDMDGQMAHWTEYFKQLLKVNPPSEQLQTTGLQVAGDDLPINEAAPSIDEVKESVAKLMGGKAAGICNISAQSWKGKGNRQDSNNYRGITLLSIPGKVLTPLLLMRNHSYLLKYQT